MDQAAQVWERLHAEGRELHFEHDADSGRVTVQLRDLDGRVLRTVSPSEVLSIASGLPG